MPRKQIGAIDADLLAEIDRRAECLGQTRRVFIERALERRLNQADVTIGGEVVEASNEPIYVGASGKPYRQSVPGPNVENVRSSAQAKRNVKPIPKRAR